MATLYRCDVCDAPAVAMLRVASTLDREHPTASALHLCPAHLDDKSAKAVHETVMHLLAARVASGGGLNIEMFRVHDYIPEHVP